MIPLGDPLILARETSMRVLLRMGLEAATLPLALSHESVCGNRSTSRFQVVVAKRRMRSRVHR